MRFVPGKILVIRLSAIGDIVMTSPVIRSLKKALPDSEIHYFTKKAFVPLLEHNPHIYHVHAFEGNLEQNLRDFAGMNFDYVLDLHHSLRSGFIRRRLGLPASAYPKYNFRTRLYTRFRIGSLPKMHVVQKYARALEPLGAPLDKEGLEIFFPEASRENARELIRGFHPEPVGIVLGATKFTKRWIPDYFPELINGLGKPVILFGGKGERKLAEKIEASLEVPALNAAGKYGLLDAIALLDQCGDIITHDTGFMHIAAALGKKIYSLWGQTVPEFGFTPYLADNTSLQVDDLDCRPCHKIGYDKCPRGHFKCMRDLTPDKVLKTIRKSRA